MGQFFQSRGSGFKAPDVKAPRYRIAKTCILNKDLYHQFLERCPDSTLSYKGFKELILEFNRKMVQIAATERDGFEFPEMLGYIFVGSCPRKKGDNPDIATSQVYGKKIQHKNWESNQYTCKVFYTNYGTKYRFVNRQFWYFKTSKEFRSIVSSSYIKNWNQFIKVSPLSKVFRFYRGNRSIKVNKHEYKGRRTDFSDTQPD